MLHYSQLHQQLVTQGLFDRFFVDHVSTQFFVLKEGGSNVTALVVISYKLLILFLE